MRRSVVTWPCGVPHPAEHARTLDAANGDRPFSSCSALFQQLVGGQDAILRAYKCKRKVVGPEQSTLQRLKCCMQTNLQE